MLQIYRPARPIQWSFLVMEGPDAADFLHRLTTVHVKALKVGEGAPGFLLTAQGKMKAYFHLWKITQHEFAFEIDAGESGKWKNEFLNTIEQFHFSEKFSLEEKTDLSCAWILGDDLGQEAGHSKDLGAVRAFHHGTVDFGKPWISVWGKTSDLESYLKTLTTSDLSFEKLETLRIQAARPRIDLELSETTIPLEVGLKGAISDNKGCYPGQEVIERIVSLGSPARRLARLDGTGDAPQPGDALQVDDQVIGQITSVVKTETGFQALAMVKKIHAKEGLEVHFPTRSGTRAKLAVITPYA